MSSRPVSLCLSSSLLSAIVLAGCADDPRARFADATLAQLDRTYTASVGLDLGAATILGMNLAGGNAPTGCPAIVTTGVDTTVTGGCTTERGERIEGSIAIHNLAPFSFPPVEPSSVDLDLQLTSREGERLAFAGRVDLDSSGIRGDLTLDVEGIRSTSRLDFRCEDIERCTLSPGAEIEISDLGSASVEVPSSDDSPDGLLRVRGEDVLVFDIAGRDSHNCVPYTVGDKRGTACRSELFQYLEGPERAGVQARAKEHPLRRLWPSR